MADFFIKTKRLLLAGVKKTRQRRSAQRRSCLFLERLESRQLLATVTSAVSLTGTAYFDSNSNAKFDANEQGVGGITIYLDSNGDNAYEVGEPSTVTDGVGKYNLTIPNDTTAVVREVAPAGWTLTYPSTGEHDVGPATNTVLTGLDFGNQISNSSYYAQISGNVFNDLSQNGQLDTGEPGLGQWQVYLDQNTNGLVDAGETSTYTDVNGNYNFKNLVPGSYTVREVLQTGWQQSTPVSQSVIGVANNTVSNVNFGNFLVQPGTVTGTKWSDLNGDGKREAGEPGVGGVTIFLDDLLNGKLTSTDKSTVTDSNGNYTFDNVPPGPHTIAEVIGPAWRQQAPGIQTGFVPAPLETIPFAANNVGASGSQVRDVDLNDKGLQDVMAFDQNRGIVSILPNQGVGNFASSNDLFVGTDVKYVLTGDVTGDGLSDIVTLADEAATGLHARDIRMDTRRNNGDGTFTLTSSIELPGILDFGTLADANNNGKLAVVLSRFLKPTDTGTQMAVLANDGSGTFTYAPNQILPQVSAGAIVSGDFTGDGYVDRVVADPTNDRLDFFQNNGNGGFLAPVFLAAGTQPTYIVSGDLNGDHLADLVAINSGSGDFSVFLNQGGGTFASEVRGGSGLNGPVAAVLANLAGTGALDLAIANAGGNNVSIFTNNGSGSFTAGSSYNVGTTPSAIVSGDLTGNGSTDLAIANSGSNDITILLNDGSGTFTNSSTYGVGATPSSITLGDLDSNSSLDLLVGTTSGSFQFLNSGNGTFGTVQPFVPSYSAGSIVSGNFGGDPAVDLLSPLEYSHDVLLWLNDGKGNYFASKSIDVGGRASSITTGDLNGDGKLDFITSYLDSDNLGIYLNNGNGTYSSGGTITLPAPASSIVTGNLEGNGNIDILVATGSNGSLLLYSNNGSGSFSLLMTLPSTGTGEIDLGDLNGDGRPDVTTSMAGNNVGVLLNSLAPNFEEKVVVSGGATNSSADFGNQKLSWKNPSNSLDVSGDGAVSPLDALIIINFLNKNGSSTATSQTPFQAPYIDPSGDDFVAPNDVLLIINYLNQQAVSNSVQPAVVVASAAAASTVPNTSSVVVTPTAVATPAVTMTAVVASTASSGTTQNSTESLSVISTPELSSNVTRTTQAVVSMQTAKNIPDAPLKGTSATEDDLESTIDDIASDVATAWHAG